MTNRQDWYLSPTTDLGTKRHDRLRDKETRQTEGQWDTTNWGTKRHNKLRDNETRQTEGQRDTTNWRTKRRDKLRDKETTSFWGTTKHDKLGDKETRQTDGQWDTTNWGTKRHIRHGRKCPRKCLTCVTEEVTDTSRLSDYSAVQRKVSRSKCNYCSILVISIEEGILKKLLWASALWVGRRKELILGFVTKRRKKYLGSKELN